MLRLSLIRCTPVLRAMANAAPKRFYSSPWHWDRRGFISNKRIIDNMFGRGKFEKFLDPKVWENMGFTFHAKEISLSKDGFEVGLNLNEFVPEDIKVIQKGRTLNITAKHERVDENTEIARSFEWAFTVPEEVKLETLTSKFSDGFLTLKADVQGMPQNQDKEHEVKIERE